MQELIKEHEMRYKSSKALNLQAHCERVNETLCEINKISRWQLHYTARSHSHFQLTLRLSTFICHLKASNVHWVRNRCSIWKKIDGSFCKMLFVYECGLIKTSQTIIRYLNYAVVTRNDWTHMNTSLLRTLRLWREKLKCSSISNTSFMAFF